MKADSAVGVVLLNYRGAHDTLACLDSLLQQQRLFDRLVICDNASPDDSMAMLRAGLQAREPALAAAVARSAEPLAKTWEVTTRDVLASTGAPPAAWVTLVDNQGNHGFAAGNNVGLRLLLRDPAITHAWLLNNDTELQPDTLAQLCAAAAARPSVDLWGGTVLYHDRPEMVQALGGGALNTRTCETRHLGAFLHRDAVPRTAEAVAAVESEMAYALGACMFATRGWLERVGLLSEAYFLYYEEADWALRGRALGLRTGYAPLAVVLHKEGASIGTAPGGGSALSVFHLFRSRMIFAKRHFATVTLVPVVARALFQVIKFVLRARWGIAKSAFAGIAEGLMSKCA